MSKQPPPPQFNSGLNQSLQGLSLSGVNSSSSSLPAPASPVRPDFENNFN